MVTRTKLASFVLLAGLTCGVFAWADNVTQFSGEWDISAVTGGELLGLTDNDFIKLKKKWWLYGQHAYGFDVKNESNHPFESYTFYVVDRTTQPPTDLPACTTIGQDLQSLLSRPLNALIGAGTQVHEPPPNSSEPAELESSIVLFFPCTGTGANPREFRMVVRSFVPAPSGGGVSHNGMIHGIG
jgi:hypothetical protein